MLRVIFDTNIYGRLAGDPDVSDIVDRITIEKDFAVYGFDLIRKEIRNISTSSVLARKHRMTLLNIYDKITQQRHHSTTLEIEHLAKQYHDRYTQLGGTYGWDTNIRIDFMIVASASIHGMDIVYSDDQKTLSSEKSTRAYAEINSKVNLRSPWLFDYAVLLKKFRGNL